ncbi:MAG: hypothetical protein ING75_03870, partial [Rhodocyclaceae bacterium]|nr:hypothetical protein [Rhodocyclaceae bacterium]
MLLDNRVTTPAGTLLDRRVAQLKSQASSAPPARPPNTTGLPDNLKHGIESLSGMNMDNVNVHLNSSKPAQLNAHAYAQGT